MGRAEDLFRRLETEGEAFLVELIAARKSEESFLDFKRSSNDGGTPRLHDHDRNHLAKALSGFANSEGGVVVWGVDCSNQGDGADVAGAKHPLQDAARFVSQIEAAVSGLTIAPVQATRTIPIGVTANGSGFAATLIPRSNHAPHQWVQEKRYYIRAGSSFEPVPHGVLAGLFGRGPQPVVFPNFKLAPMWFGERAFMTDATIVLVNDGNVVAEDLFVSAQVLCDMEGALSVGLQPARHAEGRFHFTSAFNLDFAAMGARDFRLPPAGCVSVVQIRMILRQPPRNDFRMKLVAGCRGAPPYAEELTIPAGELADLFNYATERWNDPRAKDHTDWHAAAARLLGKPAHWE